MSNIYSFLLTSAFFLLISLPDSLGNPIDGIYENSKAKVKVLVESTDFGIRAKRLDQDQWYEYQQIRPDQYRDQAGNTYYVLENDQIEWEALDGRKKIRFIRSVATDGPTQSSSVESETYARSHQNMHRRQFISARGLRGQWINRSTGQSITIKAVRSDKMLVRGSRTKWISFHRSDGDSFRDRRNNVYHFDQGILTYKSFEGDFMMQFERRRS